MNRRHFISVGLASFASTYAYALPIRLPQSHRRRMIFSTHAKEHGKGKVLDHLVMTVDLNKNKIETHKSPVLVHSFYHDVLSGKLIGVPKYKKKLVTFDDQLGRPLQPVDYSKEGFSFYGHTAASKDQSRLVSSILLDEINPKTKRQVPGLAIKNRKTMALEKIHNLGHAAPHATDIHDLVRLGASNKFLVCTSPDLCLFDLDNGKLEKLAYDKPIKPVLYSHIIEYHPGEYLITELMGEFASGEQGKVRQQTGFATLLSLKDKKLRRTSIVKTDKPHFFGFFNLMYDEKKRRGLFTTFNSHELAVFDFDPDGGIRKVKSFHQPGVWGGILSPDEKSYVLMSHQGLLYLDRKTLTIKKSKTREPASLQIQDLVAKFPGLQINFTHPTVF